MSRLRRPVIAQPLGDVVLAPSSGFQRYRWLVLVVAVALEVVVVLVVDWADSYLHPLDPVGAGVVFISVVAAGLSGTLVGLLTALAGVLASFLLLADLSAGVGFANALGSAIIWCGSAVVTGLSVGYLRRQVARREAALGQALERSVAARETMQRVLDFSPGFHDAASLTEAARAICETAVTTFGCNSARLFALRGPRLEMLGSVPVGDPAPGSLLPTAAFPDLEDLLSTHRPSFVRDMRRLRLDDDALLFQSRLGVVSTIRLPIVHPTGIIGVLSLGWDHVIERPSAELMAIMQRFADQAAIAWQSALRAEAQERAESLRQTLDRVLAFAPTFHIRGTREEVARAICEAALATFDCAAAALYRVEPGGLRVLARLPLSDALSTGMTFPLTEDMPLARELRSRASTFVPDVHDPSRSLRPWPPEVVRQTGMCSAMYVPMRFNERGPRNLLVLGWDTPRERPDQRLLVVVQRFADQAALALTNASAESLHARLEASLLPAAPLDHPTLRVVTAYRTGEQRLRLGGDFLGTALAPDGSLHFVIGDVSGHGPDAAALGATLRSSWKALVSAGEGVALTTAVMRRMLLTERREANAFATAVVGAVDLEQRILSFLNAGHPPPLLLTDEVVSLDTHPSPPLGFGEERDWPVNRFPLPPKWSLFCYTDGLTDARVSPGAPERFGEERLRQWLAGTVGRALDDRALETLLEEVESGNGGPFADDVALLAISVKD
jgi:serine phosphatase RsbU (regulator of sigma subunit)